MGTPAAGVGRFAAASIGWLLLILSGPAASGAALSDGDWPQVGGDAQEQHFSPLTVLDLANVGGLGLAWSFAFDTNRGQEATPIVVDGVMYVSSAWSKVFALDAVSGMLRWSYDPQVPGGKAFSACCDIVNRGVAVARGKVFVGTVDGRLVCLDAATGKPLWTTFTTDPAKPYTITGAPRVFGDTVLIGNAGGEYGVRGYLTAYDTESGRQKWRFYTVPGHPGKAADGAASDAVLARVARPTWYGRWYDYGGGGTVWDAIVYDPELKQIYFGVGNGTPWDRRIRSAGRGDNLFLSSIVAVDAATGAYRWHYQEAPGESWDYDADQPLLQATLRIAGRPRQVLMQAAKNGFFYVLDRRSGKFLSAENFVAENWTDGIDSSTGRPHMGADVFYEKPNLLMPGPSGGHNWQSMAFCPPTGLVYVPALELPFRYAPDRHFRFRPGAWNTAVDYSAFVPPEDPAARKALMSMARGLLIAWDPVAQKERWHVSHEGFWNGGVLATAGNLVFQGDGGGIFHAYTADTGVELWKFKAPSGIVAAPMSYSLGGVQYVAVLSGWGGVVLNAPAAPGSGAIAPPGRVLVFKLAGNASLPADQPVAYRPASPAVERFDSRQTTAGFDLYHRNCSICHGTRAEGGNLIPDLRRSGAVADRPLWNSIVMGGSLQAAGMVSFKAYLSAADAESIRAYVSQQAQKLLEAELSRPAD